VSLAGTRPSRVGAVTSTVSVGGSSVNRQYNSVSATTCASNIAQASSTAIRRSSISSIVKSSRAARPAVAVRSTDR
jgi:hypothetical protein